MHILIVEDERALCDTIARSLRRLAYSVDCCYDGQSAAEMLAVERAHLRDRAGVQKPQAIRLGDHLILRRHALRDGERLRVILRVALRRGRAASSVHWLA